ncbi:MAG: HAD hydrolase-like protein [Parasphingorhabdus sp.]
MCSPTPSVLLDLDGTLIDSQVGILSSCKAALRSLGHVPEAPLDLSTIIGPPIEEIMRLLLEPYDDDRVSEAVQAYRADYGQSGLFESVPYPGVAAALTEMRQSGARLYLATSKRKGFAQQILDHLDLAVYLDGIYGSEVGGALDQKPELISHIIEQHALIPSHCVMVGDRRYDVIGAHANKMRSLGVLWGYGSRAELEAAGVDDFVAEVASLPTASLKLATAGFK